jgi:hypothetical protein
MVIARQRLGKHVLTTMDTDATIKILLETVFSLRVRARLYIQHLLDDAAIKQRQVKTQQAGKTRTVLLVIFRVCRPVKVL